MKTTLLLAVASACVTTTALAQTDRDLDSHMHGAATLNVALVDSSVFLEFNTPWNNLVGFEHAPSTDEQRSAVEGALKLLNKPEELFSFVGGRCALAEVDIENSMGGEHDHEEEHHDDHEEDHDDHEEEDHDDHDEHEEGHDDHSEEGSAHSTVLAIYNYECKNLSQLEKIELSLFKQWSGLVDLDVQLVGGKGQTAVELNSENTTLDITQVQ